MRSTILAIVLLTSGCGAATTIDLVPVDDAKIHATADFHEALTKSFYYRVDVFVTVDNYEERERMRAALLKGTCASPGAVVETVSVHPPGGGAADIILKDGRLEDLAGHSIHVFDDDPEIGTRLACGDVK